MNSNKLNDIAGTDIVSDTENDTNIDTLVFTIIAVNTSILIPVSITPANFVRLHFSVTFPIIYRSGKTLVGTML